MRSTLTCLFVFVTPMVSLLQNESQKAPEGPSVLHSMRPGGKRAVEARIIGPKQGETVRILEEMWRRRRSQNQGMPQDKVSVFC